MDGNIKAICLLSGGLDSILAAKIIQDQGIECIGLHIGSAFFQDSKGVKKLVEEHAAFLGINVFFREKGEDYFQLLRNPKYDFGKGLNACTDCHIYFLNKAHDLMLEVGAHFIVTGDVVGQRTNSQLKRQLLAVEETTGLGGLIIRPLSGKFMQETIPEQNGWINRDKLYSIHGKGKKQQAILASQFEITEYSSLSGGCLLAEKRYSLKLRDLLDYNKELTMEDVGILTIGRHFRFGSAKVVVGRSAEENKVLKKMARNKDLLIEILDFGSPITLLQYPYTSEEKEFAVQLTALYSDCNVEHAKASCILGEEESFMTVKQISMEVASNYNISLMNFDAKKNLLKQF